MEGAEVRPGSGVATATVDQRTRRPRIADVAREAGVSKTAVSFAFNSPDRLNAATAQRIRGVADSLGYRPNPVARMLTQGRTGAIGVLTPQALSVVFSNPFYAAFTEGVASVAEDSGYGVHFISPHQGSLARAVGRATVDGVVVVGLSADHPEIGQIRQAGLPLVLIDSTALPELSSVDVDDEGGAALAADHLLGLGHRDFLVIGVEPPLPSASVDADGVTSRRLRGYRAALAARSVELAESAVVVGPAQLDGGIAAFDRAWDDGLRPTAVLAMSDAMAIGAMRAARQHGLRVPEDISIVGFDDVEIARYTDPPLTTVHQPIRLKGEVAVRILLSLVGGQEHDRSEHRRLETRLVVRGSTGPVPHPRQEVEIS